MKKIRLLMLPLLLSCFALQGCEKNEANLLEAETTPLSTVSDRKDSLCTDPPYINGLGKEIYPIDSKYEGLEFLGPLFTGYECGSERVRYMNGVEGDEYEWGSSILLKSNPTKNLLSVFKEIGFECAEEKKDENCQQWILEKKIKLKSIMKLEPFHQEFKADNCRNCFEE